ncbi:hypothetical protein [Roseomonas sp. USHLN139]|uniref:hypothetical protein n=1 Tax=Roseomonas sp. USHLN139 TaxID=3081298 RepID=UPI003B01D084
MTRPDLTHLPGVERIGTDFARLFHSADSETFDWLLRLIRLGMAGSASRRVVSAAWAAFEPAARGEWHRINAAGGGGHRGHS